MKLAEGLFCSMERFAEVFQAQELTVNLEYLARVALRVSQIKARSSADGRESVGQLKILVNTSTVVLPSVVVWGEAIASTITEQRPILLDKSLFTGTFARSEEISGRTGFAVLDVVWAVQRAGTSALTLTMEKPPNRDEGSDLASPFGTQWISSSFLVDK